MKAKLYIHGILFFLLSLSAKGQLRVVAGGNTEVVKNLLAGTNYDGGFRVAINAEDKKTALATWTNHIHKYSYAHISYVNMETTKNWAVHFNEDDKFFVLGEGSVWAHGYYSLSDSTTKENIMGLSNSINKILSLRGVSYNYKPEVIRNLFDTTTIISSIPPKRQIGLIAQEVEQVVPEVVGTEENGLKAISYGSLVALLIEGFKEQCQTIDSLKTAIDICCNRNTIGSRGKFDNSLQPSGSNLIKSRLDQNVPNPFNKETKISYYVSTEASSISIIIFDLQGNLKKQYDIHHVGESFLNISGNELSAGMYLYSLIVDGREIDTKRMILTN